MNYAAHLPNGWANIAQQLQERLAPFVAAGGRVLQVKEKFGGLRVYTEGDDLPDLADLYEAAEKTCVECGAAGTMTVRNGWVSPRCEAHK
jgi:hypothetical protein